MGSWKHTPLGNIALTTDQSDRGLGVGPHDDTVIPDDERPARSTEHKGRIHAALFGGQPLPPERLGRFVLRGTLGRGGMGTVLEAYDATLDRKVALKLLHRDLAEHHARRLVREAQALAKLSHPNVVQVYEVGEVEGRTFIAMELLRGQTLWDWQQETPRPGWRACVEVYLQAGRGLAAAHAAGLVHRDFKPGNCIIDDEGRVRVLDFGLVRELAETTVDDEPGVVALRRSGRDLVAEENGHGAPLTRPGAVLGTAAYMPLEQLDGKSVDARGDLFSFCTSLYEALYGQRPYDDETLARLSTALEKGELRPAPRGSKVPSKLRALLVRGLARNPEDRWPSMAVLLTELQRVTARRRSRWAALGLAVGALGVSTAAWLQPAAITVERCDGAEGRLADVWDEGRKQAVEAALVESGKAFGPQTWQRVEARLDGYSTAWASKYTAACEAAGKLDGPSEADTGRIFACLGQRRVALRDTVDVLASADGELVAEAVGLVAKLPGLERCDDLEALRAELPPPEDPVIAAEVELLRERLSKAETLRAAGQYDEAATEMQAVVARAEAIGYGPLLAEALLGRGMVHDTRAEYADAQRDFERTYALGVEHEYDRLARWAALHLTGLVGVQLAKHEQGLLWGQTALALASKPSADATAKAGALRVVAAVLRDQGKYGDALDLLQRALASYEATVGRQDPDFAFTLDDMAQVLRAWGKLEDSLEYDRRAIAIFEALPGDQHPDITVPLVNITFALRALGRYDEALEYLERDLAISERTLGPDHPLVVTSLTNIADVLLEQGKPDQAVGYVERSVRSIESALGPRHPDLLITLGQLASILEQQGQPEAALRHHQRSLAIAETVYGPDDPGIVPSLDALSSNLVMQDRLDEALIYAERSAAITKASFGPKSTLFADGLRTLGTLLAKQGKLDEALEHYQRGLSIEEAANPKHHRLAWFLWGIGDIQRRQGRLDDALASFRRALSITESALGPEHEDVYRATLGLAEVELDRGEPENARSHAEWAVAMLETDKAGVAPNRLPLELAWARFVLAQALWSQPEEQPRAHTLAEQARDALVSSKRRSDVARTESVQAWLARHAGK